MSSRLKKKQNRRLLPAKWYHINEFERVIETGNFKKNPFVELINTSCMKHGTMFVRPLVGCYRNFTTAELSTIINNTTSKLDQDNVPYYISPLSPIWLQAEYLEAIMEYEHKPPCGCKSLLSNSLAS
jgi:hypothetical protein